MADNVSGIAIKELELATTLNDNDDFVTENTTPKTMRVRWSTIMKKIKEEIGKDATITETDATNICKELYP